MAGKIKIHIDSKNKIKSMALQQLRQWNFGRSDLSVSTSGQTERMSVFQTLLHLSMWKSITVKFGTLEL